MEEYLPQIIEYGGRIVLAILVWLVGSIIVRTLVNFIKKGMEKSHTEESLNKFIQSLTKIGLKLLLLITALSVLGIKMTAFITILGAAGLAFGLALSGTLQNFAGGVLILIFRPFKVGDFIEAQGYLGTVKDIQIFSTILQTVDNVKVVIPNGSLATQSLTNYSVHETRRGQWVFSIPYGESFDRAEAVLRKVLEADERVLDEPAPMIFLSELNDSSVDITVRAWAKSTDFWPLNFDIKQKVYEAFNQEGISIPFPQLDVHLDK